MLDILFPFAGGLGLFLIGMMLLSEGLVAFAGGSLQQFLLACTGKPIKAFASGALITALAQSSTATTVTLIGFVSAGLISFTQAIGVVIGASLGNTATGWIVSGLGLKVNLGFYTLPLIGIGALMKLLAKGRSKELGRALAGFGILFLGLSTLQDGMQSFADTFSLAHLPAGSYGAYVLIMLIGLALTAVLQSSTAAIAMTLTALDAGAVSFDQAAAVVIGAAIGTTLTGVLVTIGGTIYAKRTAIAYILFNAASGLIALLLLPAFLHLMHQASDWLQIMPGAIALAAFHSLFIGLGALLFLPFTPQFAQLVQRLVPDRRAQPQHHLDSSLLTVPQVACTTLQRTLQASATQLLTLYQQGLHAPLAHTATQELHNIATLLEQAYDFAIRIQTPQDDADLSARLSAQLHAIDHLLRLHRRIVDIKNIDIRDTRGYGTIELADHIATLALNGLRSQQPDTWLEQVQADAQALAAQQRDMRNALLAGPPSAGSTSHALRITDSYRWFERSGAHIWRASHYLMQAREQQE
ncbi:Na/Pi cotransporter family protein [Alcaligenes sp. SDU_A2]|uniref:Na/Pi cotransporter family protein n=1 Tax=Alcaligenes sp. SDU_A2 TaxID=3136634 RepID=UPI00311DE120